MFLQTFETSLSAKSESTSTFGLNYLLIGVGALIVILLSIIVLQSFKKSKSAKRANLKSPKEEEIDKQIFNRHFHGNKTLCQSCTFPQKFHYCDLIDTDDDKRDECICDKQRKAPACSKELEINIIPLKFKNTNYSPSTENHGLTATTNEAHALPRTCTAETYLTSIGSDHYIDPVFVCKDENPNNQDKP